MILHGIKEIKQDKAVQLCLELFPPPPSVNLSHFNLKQKKSCWNGTVLKRN